LLQVPIRHGDEVIGSIGITRQKARGFTSDEIDLLRTFADEAVIAIQNVRLFTALQEKNRALTQAHAQVTEALDQQTATSEILRVISRSQTDVQPVFEAIVHSGMRLLGGYSGVLSRIAGDQAVLAALTSTDVDGDAALRALFPLSLHAEAAHPKVIRDRAPLNIADAQTDPRVSEAGRASARRRGYHSWVAVPMLHHDEALGAIAVTRREPGGFSDDEIALLQTFADQAVIAIENVRLFTELQEKNLAISEALDQQTATSDILRVISRSPTDVGPVFDAILASVTRLCAGQLAVLWLYEGGDLFRAAAFHGASPQYQSWLGGGTHRVPPPLFRPGGPWRPAQIEDAAVLPHLESHPLIRASVELEGMRTLLGVPLVRKGELVGGVTIYRREVARFSEQHVALVQTFADQAVIAIENVRLFNETKEALQRQTATSEILRVISNSPTDIQPVLDAVAESAARLCEAYDTSVFHLDGDRLRRVAHHGPIPAGVIGEFIVPLVRGSFAGRSVLDGRIVHIADGQREANEFPEGSEMARRLGFCAILSVPLLREDVAIGVITLRRTEPRLFTERQVTLLQTFADQAVIAIENVRLFKELEARTQDLTRSVGELRALGEVGRAVSSTLDLETVLTTIVTRAVELSGLDGGVVFEYGQEAEEFVHRAATETGGTLAEARRATRVRKGEGVVGRTAITLEPAQVPDITVPGAYESRLRENLITSGVRAILAVPMLRENRLIGCLVVSRNRPGEFPAETIELLRTFATQSALAIQNARLFREIADKSHQLELASQHKSEFLANMSHELRTPLNAIIGFSEVLAEGMFGEVNEKQTEYLRDILESGQHLLSLINDILDLSKIEAGRMELELTDFDLPQAINNSLTLVRERAGRRGIALHQAVDQRLGKIRGDERKIKQVLLNLLSNALKFTPEGGRVDVSASVVDGMAEVSVTDTGVGIAPEDQEAVFEEFKQVGTAVKKVEGTGLGLALSRKFIELHGGRIWVKSQVGVGSTFTFTMPLST
jgi:GAF domain-containing protein